MGEQDLEEAIEDRLKDEIQLTEEEVQSPPECHHCSGEMEYEIFNETSPQSDFVVHIVPGADQHTPPEKVIFCDISCFIKEYQQFGD